jgi:hypothetical protein
MNRELERRRGDFGNRPLGAISIAGGHLTRSRSHV